MFSERRGAEIGRIGLLMSFFLMLDTEDNDGMRFDGPRILTDADGLISEEDRVGVKMKVPSETFRSAVSSLSGCSNEPRVDGNVGRYCLDDLEISLLLPRWD
jgi:hypothetical protein